MTVVKMTVVKMTVVKMTVVKMTVVKMTMVKMTVIKMTVVQTTVSKDSSPNSLRQPQKPDWLNAIQQSPYYNCPKAYYAIVLVYEG